MNFKDSANYPEWLNKKVLRELNEYNDSVSNGNFTGKIFKTDKEYDDYFNKFIRELNEMSNNKLTGKPRKIFKSSSEYPDWMNNEFIRNLNEVSL